MSRDGAESHWVRTYTFESNDSADLTNESLLNTCVEMQAAVPGAITSNAVKVATKREDTLTLSIRISDNDIDAFLQLLQDDTKQAIFSADAYEQVKASIG